MILPFWPWRDPKNRRKNQSKRSENIVRFEKNQRKIKKNKKKSEKKKKNQEKSKKSRKIKENEGKSKKSRKIKENQEKSRKIKKNQKNQQKSKKSKKILYTIFRVIRPSEMNIDNIIENTNLSAEHYDVSRIKDDVPLTNGIMQDIRKCLHPHPLNLTMFIKCVVSASIEIVLQQTNAKNFMTKIRAFEKNVKTSQKNKSTDTFFKQLFIFETGKRKTDTPIKRKQKQHCS